VGEITAAGLAEAAESAGVGDSPGDSLSIFGQSSVVSEEPGSPLTTDPRAVIPMGACDGEGVNQRLRIAGGQSA